LFCQEKLEMKNLRVFLVFFLLVALPGMAFSAGDSDPPQPEASPSYYEQGRSAANSGNWSKAVAMFRKAVDKDSNNYKALNMLGFSLRQSGKYEGALKAYNRALSIKPDYAQALEYRGKAHVRLGNKKAALADYQKLVKMGSPLAEDLKEAIDKLTKN
jgi:tetratricopeptide (TPR) repeat protein